MNRKPGLRSLILACVLAPSAVLAQAWFFEDVTDAAGVAVQHTLSFGYSGEPDMMSGGAAAADVDNDGWIDLLVLRGDSQPPALLRNQGDGTFEDVTAASGLAITTPAGLPNGAAFADVDGNGAPDLLIGGVAYAGATGTGIAPLRLFLNDGSGRFTEATARSGLASNRNTWSAAFGDYDRDGDLDLALGQWTKGMGGSGQLWRNDGTGVFTDISVAAGIAGAPLGPHGDPSAPAICIGGGEGRLPAPRNPGSFLDQDFSFTPNFADIDSDGWPDLLIAADFCTSRVFRNNGDGTFSDWTSDVIQDENGMGAAVADYDNDGDLDWFVTSILDSDGVVEDGNNWGLTGNKLYRNDGTGAFEEVAAAAGIAAGDWGWGACFADFNNDGWLDLFHVNGMDLPPGAREDQFWSDPARMFVSNGDGTFSEMGGVLGVADAGQGRGVACFDYDRDGDVDIYINNHQGTGRLLRNAGGNLGNWIDVRLTMDGKLGAVGSRITITTADGTQMRELASASHFLSSGPIEAHFGLAGASSTELQVRWPDGRTTEHAVPVNRLQSIALEPVFADGFGSLPVQATRSSSEEWR